MKKTNKKILDHIEQKAKMAIKRNIVKQFDFWAKSWFKILSQCPEELKKYQNKGIGKNNKAKLGLDNT